MKVRQYPRVGDVRACLVVMSTSFFFAGCAAGGDGPNTTNESNMGGTETNGSGGSSSSGSGGSGVSGGDGTNGTGGGSSSDMDASTGSGGSGFVSSLTDASPTPPTATTKFPFPQNRVSTHCVYPARAQNADVQAAYTSYKQKFFTSAGAGGNLRVQRTENNNDTVSEGVAYGMLAAVYMGDQMPFDQLYKYALMYYDGKGLMSWHINSGGGVDGQGSATDADEDMAWALIMADRQWGGKGSLGDTYAAYAKRLLVSIWANDIDHGRGEMPKAGDNANDDRTNPSYFAPAFYRAFAKFSGDTNWNKVVDSTYSILDKALTHGNASNGLVPDWCSSSGSPDGSQGDYKYDACRTPFRIALDACINGEARAVAYLAKTSSFFSKIGSGAMKDGYKLDGTPIGSALVAAFVGPASVGAMSSSTYQAFVNEGYIRTGNLTRNETRYYSSSWGVFSLLMMTGNFLDYTQY